MTISKKILTSALATIGLLAATTASLAVGAHATVSLNVRSGPGTSFNVLDVLFAGENIDVTECVTQNSKNWCRIEHSGPDGWVSSSYLEANTPPAPPAPTPTPTPTPTPPPSGGTSDPNCSFGLVLGPSGPTFSITCGDAPAPTPPAPTPPPPPPPPAPVADEVCFYTGANFTGQSFCSGVGLYNSLPDMAIFNDEISSVKMFGNAHVKLWKHINQGGQSRVYNNSRTNLHANINNQASSYRVFTGVLAPTPPPAIVQLSGTYTIVQKSSGRYLDAHTSNANDFSAVTRERQFNATQAWIITPLGSNVFTVQQQSSGRYLDAHVGGANDSSAVTRPDQNNNSQRWKLVKVGADTYTMQQVHNSRYLDAHGNLANDYSAVTRPNQNNNTQRWIIQ